MAKTLKQISKELDKSGGYAADRSLLNQQLSGLPGQGAAEIAGLDAKLTQANDNILQSARSRGLGFSGIPLGEQAQYAATEYAPAVAKVKQTQEASRVGILQSLNSLSRDQRTQAQSIFEANRAHDLQLKQMAEQRRQFNANLKAQREEAARARAAASCGGMGSDYTLADLLGGGGGGGAKSTKANYTQRKDKGFNFTIGGRPVSAAAYASATKTSLRSLLSMMAKRGDAGAKQALTFVGGDGRYDPRKINSIYVPTGKRNRDVYNALTWGTR